MQIPYNVCPNCDVTTNYNQGTKWQVPTREPCADQATCVRNLRERIEHIESRLDDHRL